MLFIPKKRLWTPSGPSIVPGYTGLPAFASLQKPPLGVDIDPSNPYARGLLFAAPLNEGEGEGSVGELAVNYGKGQRYSAINAGSGGSWTRTYGSGVYLKQNTGVGLVNGSNPCGPIWTLPQTDLNECTILVLARMLPDQPNNAGSGGWHTILAGSGTGARSSSTGGPYFWIAGIGGGSLAQNAFYAELGDKLFDSDWNFSATSAASLCVSSSRILNSTKVYVSGVRVLATTPQSAGMNINSVRIGSEENNRCPNGQVYFAAIWQRALDESEVRDISLNPYQLFEQKKRVFSFRSGTAASHGHVRAIVIDHTKVSADLANFPFLFTGRFRWLRHTSHDGYVANENGYDIQFSANSQGIGFLSHEIEKYDPETGEVAMWVKLPSLSSSVDTTIYVLYGDGDISTSQEDSAGVWGDEHELILHLNEAAGPYADSSHNEYEHSAGTDPSAADGPFAGGAQSFNGSSQYIGYASASAPNPTGAVTLEAWVKTVQTGATRWLISKWGNDGAGASNQSYMLGMTTAGNLIGYVNALDGSDVSISSTGATVNDGLWHHVMMSFDANGSGKLYIDGVERGTTTSGKALLYTTTDRLTIGSGALAEGSTGYLNGTLDEVRISRISRSQAWAAASYANASSPWTFFSLRSDGTPGSYTPAAGSMPFTRAITIDHTKLDGDVSNFPVLVSGTYSFVSEKVNSPQDIRFTSDIDGNTALDFELIEIDIDTGVLVAWVRLPSVSASEDTVFYVWYGDDTLFGPLSANAFDDPTGVWDSDYKQVLHFGSPSAYSLVDSTSVGNTINTVSGTPQAASGKIHGGLFINGGYGYRNSPTGFPSGNGPWSIEIWIKKSAASSAEVYVFGFGSNSTDGDRINFGFTNNSTMIVEMRNRSRTASLTADNAWHHIAITHADGDPVQSIVVYIDGAPVSTSGSSGVNCAVSSVHSTFGAIPNAEGAGFHPTDVTIDEARVSVSARSADWIKASYNNQNSPDTFYDLGEQTGGTVEVPLAGTSAGVASVSGVLRTPIRMEAASDGVADVSAYLAGPVPIAGGSDGLATAEATLSALVKAGITNAYLYVVASEVDGEVHVTQVWLHRIVPYANALSMAAASDGVASVEALLRQPVNLLAGASDGVATVAAAVATNVPLAGLSEGSSQVEAVPTLTVGLAALLNSLGAYVYGTLDYIGPRLLQAESNGASDVYGVFGVHMEGTSDGVAAVEGLAGYLLQLRALSYGVTVVFVTPGAPRQTHSLKGASAGYASLEPNLSGEWVLEGTSSGESVVSFVLRCTYFLAGSSDGVSEFTRLLFGLWQFVQGQADGVSAVSNPSLKRLVRVPATSPSAGSSVASAQLTVARPTISAASQGSASVSAALQIATRGLQAAVPGSSRLTAALSRALAVRASSAGLASVSATISFDNIRLQGLSGGASSVGSTLSLQWALAASVSASATVVSRLHVALSSMAAPSDGVASVAASLRRRRPVQGASAGAAAVSAALTIPFSHMRAGSAGISAVSGFLTGGQEMAALAAGTTVVQGRLQADWALAAAISPSATVLASLKASKTLQTGSDGSSAVSAPYLRTLIPQRATAAGIASIEVSIRVLRTLRTAPHGISYLASAPLTADKSLVAAVSSLSAVSGTFFRTRTMPAASAGASSLSVRLRQAATFSGESPNGASTVSGTIQIAFRSFGAGRSDGVASVSAVLRGDSRMAGRADGLSAVAAWLGPREIPLAGSSAGRASALSALTWDALLVGTASAQSAVSPRLQVLRPLAGQSDGISSPQAPVRLVRKAVASSAGASSTAGALTIPIMRVKANVAGLSTIAAHLMTDGVLIAAASGRAAVAGALSQDPNVLKVSLATRSSTTSLLRNLPLLLSTSSGQSAVSGLLRLPHVLVAGSSDGAGSAAAALKRAMPFSGASAGRTTISVSLTGGEGYASANSNGRSSLAAALTVAHSLASSISCAATVSGRAFLPHLMEGASDGVASASARLHRNQESSASSAGQSSVVSSLQVLRAMRAQSAGNSAVSGAATADFSLRANSHGFSVVSGTANWKFSGNSIGLSEVVSTLSVLYALAGESNGSTSIETGLNRVPLSGSSQGTSAVSSAVLRTAYLPSPEREVSVGYRHREVTVPDYDRAVNVPPDSDVDTGETTTKGPMFL